MVRRGTFARRPRAKGRRRRCSAAAAHPRRPSPPAPPANSVGAAAQDLGQHARGMHDRDLADAGDGRIGPDVVPGICGIAGRQDLDQRDRIPQRLLARSIGCAGDTEIGNAQVDMRTDARVHAGLRHDRSRPSPRPPARCRSAGTRFARILPCVALPGDMARSPPSTS